MKKFSLLSMVSVLLSLSAFAENFGDATHHLYQVYQDSGWYCRVFDLKETNAGAYLRGDELASAGPVEKLTDIGPLDGGVFVYRVGPSDEGNGFSIQLHRSGDEIVSRAVTESGSDVRLYNYGNIRQEVECQRWSTTHMAKRDSHYFRLEHPAFKALKTIRALKKDPERFKVRPSDAEMIRYLETDPRTSGTIRELFENSPELLKRAQQRMLKLDDLEEIVTRFLEMKSRKKLDDASKY